MSEQGPTVFNGRYELHRQLARGGTADVFLARDQLLDRPVAVKVLFSSFATDQKFVDRFRQEAQSAANLSHPNIVAIYDWGEERGTYFIVMEYVEGRSLAEILNTEGPLHPDRAAEIASDVADALGFAHRNGLVHNDVKPGNILISPSGQVKVTDFGITTVIAKAKAEQTEGGKQMVFGTPSYLSPEQAQGKPVDPKSDLYSLGVVLYEALAGTPPFTGDSAAAIATAHVREKPVPPSTHGIKVARSLEAITLKLLAKNPSNRYPAADNLRSDLRRYREGQHDIRTKKKAAAEAAAAPAVVAPVEPVVEAPAPAPTPAPTPVPVAATQAMAPTAPAPAPAQPNPAGPQPGQQVVYQEHYPPSYRDDEWKRNIIFFVVLLGLLGLLFYVGTEFWKTLGFGEDQIQIDPNAEPIEVPNVISAERATARAQLEGLGFTVEVEPVPNEEVPEGIVFDQDPAAKSKAPPGTKITLKVSQAAGEATVESVVDLIEANAVSRLEDQGFAVEIQTEKSDQDAGVVIRQNPEAGTKLRTGETVVITVSEGPGSNFVPDVKGRSLAEARDIVVAAGFKVNDRLEPSSTIPVGNVITTEPGPNKELDRGEVVTLVVSSGVALVGVPSVIGLEADDARTTLETAGFSVVVNSQPVPAGDKRAERVISQTPGPNTEQPSGSIITIVVGVAEAPTDTQPPPTQPPDTNPPDTSPPDTSPPDTSPPDTQPPATQPPATQPPATDPP